MWQKMSEYLAATRHPWSCTVLLLPLLAVYEIGVLLVGQGQPKGIALTNPVKPGGDE